MINSFNYLVQLIAAVLLIGGGLTVTFHMVHGEHCLCGWLIVVLGAACLVLGSQGGGRDGYP